MSEQSSAVELSESGTGLFGTPNDMSVTMYSTPKTTKKVIIALHGRYLTSITWGPITSPTAYEHVRALLRRGYAVVSIDAGGLTPWSNALSMTAINNAVDIALARFGGTKVGLLGFSMGGLEALNYIKRYPSKVAGAMLWAPCTDLKWAYNLSGYVPAYPLGGLTADSAFISEINAAFSCTSGTFLSATAGYRIVDEYATWKNKAPIKLIHATDDNVVPIGQAREFIAGVDDPFVTMEEVVGGHGAWNGIDPKYSSNFFRSLTF